MERLEMGQCPKCGNLECEEAGEAVGATSYIASFYCPECGADFDEVFRYAYTEVHEKN